MTEIAFTSSTTTAAGVTGTCATAGADTEVATGVSGIASAVSATGDGATGTLGSGMTAAVSLPVVAGAMPVGAGTVSGSVELGTVVPVSGTVSWGGGVIVEAGAAGSADGVRLSAAGDWSGA